MNHDWMASALCRDYKTDLFYPEGTGRERSKAVKDAVEVCSRCPVQARCDEWATRVGETNGVWGGRLREGRPKPTRKTPDHGTPAMAQRHRRAGERPCDLCLRGDNARRRRSA